MLSVRSVWATLTLSALSSAIPVHADFQAALREYNAGHYDVAHAQFLALAELGDCSSQFNLGAMALQGQGGPKDAGSGVGWLQAAAGNGCERLVGNKVAGLTAKLSADESAAAAGIVARYGRDALHTQGIVSPDFSCREQVAASVLQAPAPEYPHLAGDTRQGAVVITELTIGVDGLARDPEILLAVPETGFPAAAVESWLNSRFVPASRGGAPIESRLQAKSLFAVEAGSGLSGMDAYKSARQRADAGDPVAGYLLELTATLDASLGISSARAGQLLLAASPLDAVRDPGTALSVAMKLAGGEIQSDPQMFEAVGAAYAANGDFRQASAQQQLAIRRARSLAWNTRVMAQRLAAYRGGRPWRGDLFALPPNTPRAN